jgi:hypothetical protein
MCEFRGKGTKEGCVLCVSSGENEPKRDVLCVSFFGVFSQVLGRISTNNSINKFVFIC